MFDCGRGFSISRLRYGLEEVLSLSTSEGYIKKTTHSRGRDTEIAEHLRSSPVFVECACFCMTKCTSKLRSDKKWFLC